MTPKTPVKKTDELLHDLRNLIEDSRLTVATMVNASLTMLYWRVGKRINEEILKGDRAEYGEKIVHALSTQLQQEYGKGFAKRTFFNMIRLADVFPDETNVSTLSRQLGWSHFKEIVCQKKEVVS